MSGSESEERWDEESLSLAFSQAVVGLTEPEPELNDDDDDEEEEVLEGTLFCLCFFKGCLLSFFKVEAEDDGCI